MASSIAEQEFTGLVNEYIDAETKVEITRQVLVERKDFDAYSCYSRLANPDLSGITRNSMKQFLRENGLVALEADMDLLFWKLDIDSDGYINWTEFLDLIQSKELSKNNVQHGSHVEQSVELEHSMTRIFEQELLNQVNMENIRRKLHLSSLTETKLFDSIDRDGKGYFSETDLLVWLKFRNAATNYSRYERAFRRMDLNNDGRINFEEFLQIIRPAYNFSSSYSYKLDKTSQSNLDLTYVSPVRSMTHVSPVRSMTYVSPVKSIRESINDTKEKQISQKLEEIKLLRQEINDNKFETEKEAIKYTTPRESDVNISMAKTVNSYLNQNTSYPFMSSYRKSIYADKYSSPARRLAVEVREEIQERSMDKMRQRSLYESSNRQTSDLTSSRLKLELEESRRWWKDRYSSPLRYSRYYSPLRSTLELERLKDQRERQRLAESMAASRNSLARDTLRRDIEEKRSELQSKSLLDVTEDLIQKDHKEISPANKSRMVLNLRDSIWDNKVVEDKRIDLSLRYDFSLQELFNMVDFSKTGSISLLDWERFVYDNNILMNRVDLCIIVEKYDINKNGLLSFSEFCEIFLPTQPEFRASMQNRVQRKINTFFEYSGLTKDYIKELLRMIVNVQERFEDIKFKLSDGRVLNSDEIFKFLDKWKTGYVTLPEFEQALNEAGIICSDRDVKSLFDQFDRNKDGRITFDEFHSPMRNRFNY